MDGKSNEITAIPLLETLAPEGTIVTLDATRCARAVSGNAAAAILDRTADYLLALNGNQSTLHDDVKLFFADSELTRGCDRFSTADCGQGRMEPLEMGI